MIFKQQEQQQQALQLHSTCLIQSNADHMESQQNVVIWGADKALAKVWTHVCAKAVSP